MEFPYEKDNKERIPFEHYLSEYQKIDPKEAAERCAWNTMRRSSSFMYA